MRELAYSVLDVFAERPLEGNPLAVFADGSGLSAEMMQSIARELNLSETTFILPRDAATEAERGVRVRIFTTEEELPFAGHPTLGTATFLHEHHAELRGSPVVRLELNVGMIPVRFRAAEEGRPGSFATMRQNDPQFLARGGSLAGPDWPGNAAVAEALGLKAADLSFGTQTAGVQAPIQVVTTGNAFCIVPVRDLAALGRLELSPARARPLLDRMGARFFYCLAPNASASASGSGAAWRGRMQFGGGEDPATGSAAGCVAAWLVQYGFAASGEDVVLEQGIEMLRPSRLTLRASLAADGRIVDVFVGGRTIPVASGRLFLP